VSQNRDNTGVLFRNSRKKLSKAGLPLDDIEAKKPDHTGEVTVDGRDYWLAAWVKESKDQKQKYFSLSFTLKEGK